VARDGAFTLTRLAPGLQHLTVVTVPAAAPLLGAGIILLFLDRTFGTHFFVAGAAVPGGGDPIMFQHLFWIFGHPEVYILILPAWGIISDVLAFFSRKPAYSYKWTVAAMGTITLLSAVVYGLQRSFIGYLARRHVAPQAAFVAPLAAIGAVAVAQFLSERLASRTPWRSGSATYAAGLVLAACAAILLPKTVKSRYDHKIKVLEVAQWLRSDASARRRADGREPERGRSSHGWSPPSRPEQAGRLSYGVSGLPSSPTRVPASLSSALRISGVNTCEAASPETRAVRAALRRCSRTGRSARRPSPGWRAPPPRAGRCCGAADRRLIP
jgi:hypothetical protein